MKICLFGAASDAVDPAYLTAAEEFGASLAQRGHELVFGGGATGLMGAAARGVRRAGAVSPALRPGFSTGRASFIRTAPNSSLRTPCGSGSRSWRSAPTQR